MADVTPLDEPGGNLAPVITWRTALIEGSDCPTCKYVGLGLSLYMNERGGSAFPSVTTLATDLSLGERTVRKHLNEHLHAQGWLTLVKRGGKKGDRRSSNEWQASTPAPYAGVPRHLMHGPRHQSATTPAAGAAYLVQEHDVEIGRLPGVWCMTCNDVFGDTDAYTDHIDVGTCPGNEGYPEPTDLDKGDHDTGKWNREHAS